MVLKPARVPADALIVTTAPTDFARLDELQAVASLFGPAPGRGEPLVPATRDPDLERRLLGHVNGAGLPHPAGSLREAGDALGWRGLRRAAMLVALAAIARGRPETLEAALRRAKTCELVALARGDLGALDDHFLVGLVSATEPLVGAPLEEIVATLPLSPSVRAALDPAGAGHLGSTADVLAAVRVAEDGRDGPLAALVPDPRVLPRLYERAAMFADGASRALPST